MRLDLAIYSYEHKPAGFFSKIFPQSNVPAWSDSYLQRPLLRGSIGNCVLYTTIGCSIGPTIFVPPGFYVKVIFSVTFPFPRITFSPSVTSTIGSLPYAVRYLLAIRDTEARFFQTWLAPIDYNSLVATGHRRFPDIWSPLGCISWEERFGLGEGGRI